MELAREVNSSRLLHYIDTIYIELHTFANENA